MKLVKLGWKLARAVLHAVSGFWTIRSRFHKLPVAQHGPLVQAWARQMLAITGIDLVVRGQPPAKGPVLLVANHISWLDILVIHAAGHCRFVSKSDVKRWPFVSTLAMGAGTLFIERDSRRDALRVVHHMVEGLQAGDVLAVFPEGTTGDGLTLKPFHANLLQAAITVNAPVQPMALRFIDRATGRISLAPRYVDDDSLAGSIWQTLMAHNLCAEVSFGLPELAQGRDRRSWAGDLQREVERLRDGMG